MTQVLGSNFNQPAMRHGPSFPKILGSPSTVFIGDLPKDISQVELYDYLRENVGGDFEIVLKR
jgi:RNA recognition motif-containing protein